MDRINDIDLKSFGLLIQTGTAKLLEYPERKQPLFTDWQDEDGIEYQLDAVHLKDKEVTLSLVFLADSDSDFWQNYDAFFAEITQPGWQSLYVHDHSQTYEVFYKSSSNWVKKQKRLKNVDKVFVKFELTLQVK